MKAVQFGRKCNEEGEERQKLGAPEKVWASDEGERIQ